MKRKKPREHKRRLRSRKFTKKRGKTILVNKGIRNPFSPMPKVFHHPLETAVYVPSTKNNIRISDKDFHKRINETRKTLAGFLGGYTSVQGMGGWVDEIKKDGKITEKLIKEPIVKVTAFGTKKEYLKNRKKYLNWIKKKLIEWKQSEIGYEYEGDFFRILKAKRK